MSHRISQSELSLITSKALACCPFRSNTSNEVDQMIEELLAADEGIDKCNDHQPLTTLPLTNKPSHNDKKYISIVMNSRSLR